MDADKHIVRTRRLTKLGRRDAEYLGEIKSLPQGGRASCAGGGLDRLLRACLTVVAVEPAALTVQASVETLTRTTLGEWEEGTLIETIHELTIRSGAWQETVSLTRVVGCSASSRTMNRSVNPAAGNDA